MELNVQDWKEFRLNKVFSLKGGFYNKKPEHSVVGTIPFLASTENNNGVTEYYSLNDIISWDKVGEPDNTLENKTKEEFMDVLNVNLIAPFLLSKYASKYMIKNNYGKIINIASTNGIDTYYPSSLDYDASKAGLISLTHNLAIELAPYITVNAIAPGWTNTDMNKNLSEEQKKKINERILLKRFANPDEIANVVAFLASPEASYINNEVIRVDGGSFNDSI